MVPRFLPALLAGVALMQLAASCTADDETLPDPAVELSPPELNVDGLEVDELIVMQPGGFAIFDQAMLGADEVLSSRHVLRTSSPNGPIDLFDLILTMEDLRDEPGGPDGPQRCTALTFDDGMSMSCSPIDQAAAPFDGLVSGWSSDDAMSVIELLGPEETTHFIVIVDERRYGVTAVAGQAVLPLPGRGGPCPGSPSLVEAWSGDALLMTDVPDNGC